MIPSCGRRLLQAALPNPRVWLQRSLRCGAQASREEATTSSKNAPAMPNPAMSDLTATKVVLKGAECRQPKDARTDLLRYLVLSDIQKKTGVSKIPIFTPGSYLAVTRSDSLSPTGKTRFVGICIAKRNKGLGSTFILRNVINGFPVEMTFEIYSPKLIEVKVLKLERRRRAKLYYLRDKPLKYSTVSEDMEPVDSGGRVLKYRRKRGALA